MVSNIFYVHPYLGKISILTNIFQMGWFNHQLDVFSSLKSPTPPLGRKALNPEPFDELFLGSDLPFVVKVRVELGMTGRSFQGIFFWVVVSNIFDFHPYLGMISNLTSIFQFG